MGLICSPRRFLIRHEEHLFNHAFRNKLLFVPVRAQLIDRIAVCKDNDTLLSDVISQHTARKDLRLAVRTLTAKFPRFRH